MHKTFIRSQLDYPDVIYDQQQDISGTITGKTEAIKGTSPEKLYQELELESRKSRRWFRKLCHFYKILNKKSPSYLADLIPNLDRVHDTRHISNILAVHERHDYLM